MRNDNFLSYSKRILNNPLLLTMLIAFVMITLFYAYLGSKLYGNMFWALWPSEIFGVPESMQRVFGYLPYFRHEVGSDGQFYFYISNDLLGLNQEYISHVDNPPYRWQRIGLPLTAKIVSLLTLHATVTPGIFLFTNISLFLIATYVLARYLKNNHQNPLWVLPWVCSLAVMFTALHGLADSAADAFFIFAFIGLLNRRWVLYSLFISLASITREGYVLFAFFVFCLGFFGVLDKDKKWSIKFAALLAVPGIIVLGWQAYVSIHFNAIPATVAYNITQPFLVGFYQHIVKAAVGFNVREMIFLPLYVIAVLLLMFLPLVIVRKSKFFLPFVPYAFLMGCFGPALMGAYVCYMKGISIFFAIFPLMLPYLSDTPKLKKGLAFFVILTTLISFFGYWQMKFFLEQPGIPTAFTNYGPYNEKAQPLKTPLATLEVINAVINPYATLPLSRLFVKKHAVYTVKVTNNSNQIWYKNGNKENLNGVFLSYQWYKADDTNKTRVVKDGLMTSLPRDIQPNETFVAEIFVDYPMRPGSYILSLSLIQAGVVWFHTIHQGYQDVNVAIPLR